MLLLAVLRWRRAIAVETLWALVVSRLCGGRGVVLSRGTCELTPFTTAHAVAADLQARVSPQWKQRFKPGSQTRRGKPGRLKVFENVAFYTASKRRIRIGLTTILAILMQSE